MSEGTATQTAQPTPWLSPTAGRRLTLAAVVVFVLGLFLTHASLLGLYGRLRCGTLGMDCFVRAFFSLLASQALAALLFWLGAAGLPRRTWERWLTLGAAVFSSLIALGGLGILIDIHIR